MSRRSTSLPSALETIFWVTTTMSPDSRVVPWAVDASTIRSPRESPGWTSGMPVTPMIWTRGITSIST